MGDPVVEKAVLALDDRAVKLDNRVETIEGKVRNDQAETIREHGLPAYLVSTETNVWRRLSPVRNRWPEIAASMSGWASSSSARPRRQPSSANFATARWPPPR